ncbi:N-acylneuraminate cytidylyltransferase [Desulfomicrobium macestii]|uniref:N-acylneuraminate cytidylyltransferase n=1 Tax=Desulfomicrobium macestii TaxID=90731 RepID=A0ABR9H6T2_9BACT|nr:hypothetical protein [Desulfomicrobium macestii]MBE1426406.1 N-acylneuraminate cytidylyltransferase [Desulfomicrobium macestii]
MGSDEFMRHIIGKYFKYQEYDNVKWAEEFRGERDKVVVHIPARTGSTRLKNKNVAMLGGKPLIAYTITMAKAMGVDRIIVSTDGRDYADLAESLGAEVPFLRPKELSGDNVSPYYSRFFTIRHLMDEEYPLKAIIDMYPVNPFRNLGGMKQCLEKLRKSGFCATCVAPSRRFDNYYYKGTRLSSMVDLSAFANKVPVKIVSSFSGCWVNMSEILYYDFQLANNPFELLDLDTESDFRCAEMVVSKGLYDFGVEI